MDKMINSKVNKQAIYEIYRACRLCGAGAGYKMPIIQNVLDVDGDEVELRQKIRECVQIEVNQDDKMPPLICELCVDKVNDFYEFMEMCRQTNKRTRLTLGLPLQKAKKGVADGSDCILGVTEPVYVTKKEEEPRSSPRHAKSKTSKETKPTVKVKMEVRTNEKESKESNTRPSRSLRGRSPSPRSTRRSRSSQDDNMSLSKLKLTNNQHKNLKPSSLKSTPTKPTPPQPKSILKKPVKTEISPSLRSKRLREPPKSEIPQKKVKLSVRPHLRSPPKSPPKPPPKPPKVPEFSCTVCKQRLKTPQALTNHSRTHLPQFTSHKLACNSCCEWFENVDAAFAHHKRHRAKNQQYKCRGCGESYKTAQAYDEHASTECVPWTEVPDVKCDDCWRTFPTDNLRSQHRCLGEDGRPGGKCNKCRKQYSLLKNLLKHETTCTVKRKMNFKIDPELMKKVRPIQILVSKCDPLLEGTSSDHYDVSAVPEYYGLHYKHNYPYLRSRLHPNSMVSIKTELDDFYCEEDYIHWDSDVSDDDVTDGPTDRKVNSLSTLALKTLFSQKCLGRVPKKRRKVKVEEKSVFDSMLNNDFDDMSTNIDSIIDNLGDDDDKKEDDVQNVKAKDSLFVTEYNDSDAKLDSLETEETVKDSSDNLTKEPIAINNDIDSVVDKVDINEQKVVSDSSVSEPVADSNTSVSEVIGIADSNTSVSEVIGKDLENTEQKSMEVVAIEDDPRTKDDGESTDDKEMDAHVNDGLESIEDDVNNVDEKNISDDEKLKDDEILNDDDDKMNDDEKLKDDEILNDDEKKKGDEKVKDEKMKDENINDDEKMIDDENVMNDDENVMDDNEEMKNDEKVKDVEKMKDDENVIDDDEEMKADLNDDEKMNNDENVNDNEKMKNDVNESYDEKCLDNVDDKTPICNQNNDSKVIEDKDENPADIDNSYNETEAEKPVENMNNSETYEDAEVANDITQVNENILNATERADLTSEDNIEDKSTDITEQNEEDSKNVNGDVEEKSDKLNMDDFVATDTEIDDKKLMEALDEHIGDNDDKKDDLKINNYSNDVDNAKITLEDLIPNKDSDTKSMDLDSISDDDFNFND